MLQKYKKNAFFFMFFMLCHQAVIGGVEAQRRPLSGDDLKNKREGGYFTGLPIVISDSDEGLGLGGKLTYYFNGKKDDTRFAYAPYFHKVYFQGFKATRGLQFYTLNYDAPYFLHSNYRIRASLLYLQNTNSNFFGYGEDTLGKLKSPSGETFTRFSQYRSHVRQIDSNQLTDARRDKYILRSAGGQVKVENDLLSFLSGIIRPSVGLKVDRVHITDYSFNRVKVADDDATQKITRLRQAEQAGVINGYDGGWDNLVKTALVYDSRDFEPDPNRGWFIELIAEYSREEIGSSFNYNRYIFSPKLYYSPWPDDLDLTLAARLVYSVSTGVVPFYAQGVFSFTEREVLALGGANTLRGYKAGRFVGPVMALANFEIRYTYFTFKLFGQYFKWIFVPFVDIGRVYNDVAATSLSGLKFSYGIGLRGSWNQASVGTADIAFSEEDIGIFLKANHIF